VGRMRSFFERLRRSDERILESPAGWLLPGGWAYKLGRRNYEGTPRWRVWPLGGGLLDWWNYNVGRERARRERGIDE
jgi:hypothetical protein